jgi:hypothetical protein
MKSNPLVSIVVLNYNGIKYLRETIPLLLKQNYPNYEVIFVDNGSSADNIEFIKKNKDIKLIQNNRNLGYNLGKNIGVNESNGEFVLLLDDDIKIRDPNFLRSILFYYEKIKKSGENIGFLSPLLIDFGDEKTKYYGIYYSLYGKKINKKEKLTKILSHEGDIKIGSFNGAAVFFEKKVWMHLKGYDEDYVFGMDDFDIGARAYNLGYTNYLFKDHLVHIGKNKDSNKKHFAHKFSFYYEGIITMVIKNYNTKNFILFLLVYPMYLFLLNIFLIFYKMNLYLIFSPIIGLFSFFKKYGALKEKRKINQMERITQNDIFLRIKIPKFK